MFCLLLGKTGRRVALDGEAYVDASRLETLHGGPWFLLLSLAHARAARDPEGAMGVPLRYCMWRGNYAEHNSCGAARLCWLGQLR